MNQRNVSNYDSEVITKWNLIKNESQKVHGVIEVDTDNLPDWIDRDRYVNVCLPIIAKIRPSQAMSGLVGLAYLVQVPSILPPLLFTKKSQNICALFSRYLDTLLYVRTWHTTDIFDPDTEGYKSLALVRSMHRHINKVMNATAEEHSKPKKIAPNVWVSQYDMVVTQWAFFGLQIMHPEACGLYHVTDEELYEVIYSWRVISYFIGIDDRFSLCLDDLKKTRQLCHIIFEEVYRPVLKNQDTVGSKMAEDIFKSMSEVVGPFTAQTANKYWFKILDIKTEVHLKTWSEFFLYNFLKLFNGVILKWSSFYSIINWLLEWNINKHATPAKKREITEKLKQNPVNTEIRYVFKDDVF